MNPAELSMKHWLDADMGKGVPHPQGVRMGVTNRGGASTDDPYASFNVADHVGDDASAVQHNRIQLASILDATQIQWLRQVHSTRVIHAQTQTTSQVIEGDAMWTDQPGLALAIMTADCVPVLLWSGDGTVVGAAHAGWRGLVEGILPAVISQMPVPRAALHAWIGPYIEADRYEVGEDVWSRVVALQRTLLKGEQESQLVSAYPHDLAKRCVDLGGLAKLQLQSLGLHSVVQSGLCSYADERFYSYRRAQRETGDSRTGRMASVILRSL